MDDLQIEQAEELMARAKAQRAAFLAERKTFLSDILVSAMEGGSNYWCVVLHYHPDECTATIVDGETGIAYDISAKTIRKGAKLIVDHHVPLRKDIVLAVYWGWMTNDAGDIDGEIADCIVQAGLLGEVIYG